MKSTGRGDAVEDGGLSSDLIAGRGLADDRSRLRCGGGAPGAEGRGGGALWRRRKFSNDDVESSISF